MLVSLVKESIKSKKSKKSKNNKSQESKKKKKYWQIYYSLDINELIVRNDSGKLTITIGLEGEQGIKKLEQRVATKLKQGWKKCKKHPMLEDELEDLRFKLYDYDGKKK